MIPIKGVQKTTLVDYPGALACTVFLGGCDFRCGYCYNRDLVLKARALPSLPEEEFFSFLDSRKGILEGVCITGGEPTLWEGLATFCRKIKESGFKVKLDTNGARPERVKQLIDAKLVDYVAMDLKAPLEKYASVTGVDTNVGKIRETISLLIQGESDYEFRTTIVPDKISVREIREMACQIQGAKRYYLQQFRASATTINPRYADMEPLSGASLRQMQEIASEYVKEVGLRNVE